MAKAIKASDLKGGAEYERRRDRREGGGPRVALRQLGGKKTWDQLTEDERELVMKHIAIRMGMVAPDP